jgi:uncharacterized protein
VRMPDVNVLIYAHRTDFPGHAGYREWLEAMVADRLPFGLSILVAVGFLRVVTSLPPPYGPTPQMAALAVVESLLARDKCRLLVPGPRHWSIVASLCRATSATGKQVADAQHAALAIECGGEWVTRDRDFAAFEPHGLRWSRLWFEGEPLTPL